MADRGRGSRMTKQWIGAIWLGNNFTADSTQIVAILADFLEAGTILRMLGELSVTPGATGVTDNDAAQMTVGIGLVSTDAATLGSTAMPDPAAELDYDWLWWYSVAIDVPNEVSFAGQTASARIPISSKAMRRFKPRSSLVVIGQYSDGVGIPPLSVIGSTRVLVAT